MILYLYEKELQKDAKEDGLRQGIEKGIQALILDNLEEGAPKERIINKIETRFEISEEQAVEYFEKYSKNIV